MTVMMKRQMSLGPKQNDQEIENVEGRARASESEREREKAGGNGENGENLVEKKLWQDVGCYL